jgi:hypothetical protein
MTLPFSNEEQTMREIDRRSVLTGILCGAAVTTIGLTIMPKAAKSLPLGAAKDGVVEPEALVEEAAVRIHVHPRRHHRHRNLRWRCWKHRGRRVCGWR